MEIVNEVAELLIKYQKDMSQTDICNTVFLCVIFFVSESIEDEVKAVEYLQKMFGICCYKALKTYKEEKNG